MLKSDPELINKYEKEKDDLKAQLRTALHQIEMEKKSREAAETKRTRSNEEIAQLKHEQDRLYSELDKMELLRRELDMKQQKVSQVFHPFIFLISIHSYFTPYLNNRFNNMKEIFIH